jgi:hypothetical protein
VRPIPWIFALVLSAACVVPCLAATKQTKAVKWIRGLYVAESPMPQRIPTEQLWITAESNARAVGGVALRGDGESMLPLYAPGTVLVIAPTPFDNLRRGQTVIYRNSANREVAHVLVAKCRTGWRVAGLNNRSHDGEGVNSTNLCGVVIAAYTPDNTARIALRD